MNVEGNKMMEKLSKELDFPYQKNGSLVVCTNEKEVERLYELLERGRRNGVEELQILDRAALKAMEPNIADEAVAALYAPTGGISDQHTGYSVRNKSGRQCSRGICR